MKELSIEEKAKAYDSNYKGYTELVNRLENVKDAIKKQNYGIAMDILYKPYPEYQIITSTKFKESEDERIRKAIIHYLKDYSDGKGLLHTNGVTRNDAIAWLEKQGNLMKALQISNARIGELIEKNYYLKEQLEKQGENNMGISEATKQELEENLNKALEKETPESCNDFLEKQGEQNLANSAKTCKDEQNPIVEMKTPEESLGIDSETYNKIVDECIYGEQKPADKIESRQEELTEFEKAVKQVMEETIECGDIHNLKADADMLLRLVQKPAWSEEEEKMIQDIINDIAIAQEQVYCKSRCEDEIDWLNSLKERYTWRPSDEQLKAIKWIIDGDNPENWSITLENLYQQLKKLREK